MIVFFDPVTLAHNHIINEPLGDDYYKWLYSDANQEAFIRHPSNMRIDEFTVRQNDFGWPFVAPLMDMVLEVDGDTIHGIPPGSYLDYDGETYQIDDGTVELELEGSGEHLIRIRSHGYKTFELKRTV